MRSDELTECKPDGEVLVRLFDALLAGSCTEDVHLAIQRLPQPHRQDFLCTACEMRDEIAENCTARAVEVDHLLNRNCDHYLDGVRTCTRYRTARV